MTAAVPEDPRHHHRQNTAGLAGPNTSKQLTKTSRDGWKTTIGLELHVQLKSPVKLFSRAVTSFDDTPNKNVAALDAALPGTLPVLNAEPVKLAILAALAMNCEVHQRSKFDRKHYFYPDLPAGYQITQKYSALATNGRVQLSPRHDGLDAAQTVRVTQVQLEQDTAKSTYDAHSSSALIDLNRTGTALVEIISEPDLTSSVQAAAYVRKVQSLLKAVGASDADMEKGSMRIDVNVSVAKEHASELGKRCEIKNLNSVRSMVDAIEHETDRHIELLSAGGAVEQQTRGFDALTSTTFMLRSKADTPDYRYMPDPELAPLVIPTEVLSSLRAGLPELPDAKRERLERAYGLAEREVDILVRLGEESAADEGKVGADPVVYFEDVARGRSPRAAANWILHDLLGNLTKQNLAFAENPVSADQLGSLIDAVEGGRINVTTGKSLLAKAVSSQKALGPILQVAIEAAAGTSIDYAQLVGDIIAALPKESEKVRRGNKNVLARLIGEGMKRTGGKADATELRGILESRLK